jgi:hypothetical protein
MYKRKHSTIFICAFITLFIGVLASFFYSFQRKDVQHYYNLMNGETINAKAVKFEGVDYCDGYADKWLYTFTVDGVGYYSSTMGHYGKIHEGDEILVRYFTDKDGKIVLQSSSSNRMFGGKQYALADSQEDEYLQAKKAPNFSATIAIGLLGLIPFGLILYSAIWIMVYRRVEMLGTFTYAVFEEGQKSKLSKSFSIRYSYQNEKGEFITKNSPYTFSPSQVDAYKYQNTIKIKYYKNLSVIMPIDLLSEIKGTIK